MAENRKAVLRQIRSVRNTQQITQAMRMIAAAKLHRTQTRAIKAHPYAEALSRMLAQLVEHGAGLRHPLLRPREAIKTIGYVVFTSDRGLAGPYNNLVIRCAEQAIAERTGAIELITVGAKGRDYFVNQGRKPLLSFTGFDDEAKPSDAREVADAITELYLGEKIDEIHLVHMSFTNISHQQPVNLRLLPLTAPGTTDRGPDFTFIPNAEAIVDALAPRFVATQVHQALREAKASEHSARMLAMEDASTNADDMIQRLTLKHNRARQAAITREVTEIVGSSAARSD
jgi:F-type H+-transporting ATPase subunit gamma